MLCIYSALRKVAMFPLCHFTADKPLQLALGQGTESLLRIISSSSCNHAGQTHGC